MMKNRLITGKTKVYGVIGYPITHSLSPVMFNAAFEHCRLDSVYVAFPMSEKKIRVAWQGLGELSIQGLNVTSPLKEVVHSLCTSLTEAANIVGAVNTVAFGPEGAIGHNTDGSGFLRSLIEDSGFEPQGARVLMLGAGGAARALAFTLATAGVEQLFILNRTFGRAWTLSQETMLKAGRAVTADRLNQEQLLRYLGMSDLLINTIPRHQLAESELVSWIQQAGSIKPRLVADLNYGIEPTALLSAARDNGCAVMDGLGMLVYQGAAAFEWWTGREAPVDVMRQAAESHLALNVE